MELPGDSSKIVRWDRTKGIIAHGTLEGGEKVTWTRIPDNEIMDVSDDISEKRKANWGGTSDGPPEVDDADNINGAGVSIDPLLSSALDLLKKNFIDPQPKIWKEDLKYSDNSEFAAFVDDLFRSKVMDGKEYDVVFGAGVSYFEKDVTYVWNLLMSKRRN